jgi:hypothetical protein
MNDHAVSKIADIPLLQDKLRGRLFHSETAFSQVGWATKHGDYIDSNS